MIYDRPNTPGATIRDIRKIRGMKQSDLAQSLGVSKACISRYENGSRQMTVERYMQILTELSAGLLVRY